MCASLKQETKHRDCTLQFMWFLHQKHFKSSHQDTLLIPSIGVDCSNLLWTQLYFCETRKLFLQFSPLNHVMMRSETYLVPRPSPSLGPIPLVASSLFHGHEVVHVHGRWSARVLLTGPEQVINPVATAPSAHSTTAAASTHRHVHCAWKNIFFFRNIIWITKRVLNSI